MSRDLRILRDLAKQYAEAAAQPIQDERRRLWADHFSLRTTRTPILITYGVWNVWCRETFGEKTLQCEDPFHRQYERELRMELFHDSIGDDYILEPWISVGPVRSRGWGNVWGVEQKHRRPGVEGGAWKFDPPIKTWDDVKKLSAPPHEIDEAASARNAARLREIMDGILEVNVTRGPVCWNFLADISTDLAQLRDLEQLMIDMMESPRELHALLAFMRDGILANQDAAEAAGDFSLTHSFNQAMPYCDELPWPAPNLPGRRRKELWGFFAAQEFTSISPAMHDEFLLQYQLPIIQRFGLIHYGCCEDLTRKIDMLRQIPNLRSIAVTPRADVRHCAEQIRDQYVISWRPNPTDMIAFGFDRDKIQRIIREGMEACRGGHVHLHLKDVETVSGDPGRLAEWTRLVREVTDAY